jgi:flagellar biosynthesis protein FlhF
MKLKKFFGLTSRSVLEQVRSELGADAVIMSNRPNADGIEITAMASDAMDTILGEMPEARRRTAGKPEPRPAAAARTPVVTPWKPPHVPTPTPVAVAAATQPSIPVDTNQAQHTHEPRAAASAAQMAPPVFAPSYDHASNSIATAHLAEEVAAMRTLLEGQVAQLAWGDAVRRQPLRARFTRELIASGYSPALAREITQRMPDDYSIEQAQQWLLGVLAKNIRCTPSDSDIVATGGVYALTGPTGVGKTTTTAKLAARCAVRYGSSSLALLTTDSYRVGAQDQLRIYAKILGVNVQTVSDTHDLRQALDSLRGKRLVLIDTVGMGQRDERISEQAMLLAQPQVRRLLLLNATSQAQTLEEVVGAYDRRGADKSQRVAGCIITKQDEAACPGQVLDVIIRHRLELHYVSNGQRVPEDLQSPNASYLVHRSFKPPAAFSPFRMRDDEFALMFGGATGVAHA